MNRVRLTLVRSGAVVPAPTSTVTVGATPVQCDPRAVQARQRDAGATRRALAILERAAQRPMAMHCGRRLVDARTQRAIAYVG